MSISANAITEGVIDMVSEGFLCYLDKVLLRSERYKVLGASCWSIMKKPRSQGSKGIREAV